MFLRKAVAFIKRDFAIATSYKLTFILQWLSSFFPLFTFYFIGKLFEKNNAMHSEVYGEKYFPYVLIGLAVMNLFGTGIGVFSRSIRREQLMGTLGSILITPNEASVVILSMGFWNLIFSTVVVFSYLICGVLFLGVDFSNANILTSVLAFVLTAICSISLGIISASFIIIYKMGDPIGWTIGTLSGFLGGVFFPVTILPKGLQMVSYLLPITYSLKIFRLSLLQGCSFAELSHDILILFLFSIFVFYFSMQFFKYAVKKTKKTGSLLQY